MNITANSIFEKIVSGKVTAISEAEARRLLVGNCRDVAAAMESIRANPWAQWRCDGCTIRYTGEAVTA